MASLFFKSALLGLALGLSACITDEQVEQIQKKVFHPSANLTFSGGDRIVSVFADSLIHSEIVVNQAGEFDTLQMNWGRGVWSRVAPSVLDSVCLGKCGAPIDSVWRFKRDFQGTEMYLYDITHSADSIKLTMFWRAFEHSRPIILRGSR